MKLLIKDTTVVTGNDQRTVLYNAGIVIEDRRISDIGTSMEVESRHPLANVRDCNPHYTSFERQPVSSSKLLDVRSARFMLTSFKAFIYGLRLLVLVLFS